MTEASYGLLLGLHFILITCASCAKINVIGSNSCISSSSLLINIVKKKKKAL